MRLSEHDIMASTDPAGDLAEELAKGQSDDLEAINGIGPKFAEALHAAGIRRYADLVDYEPEALSEALLAQAGVRVPSERIEANHWIDQAQRLTSKTKAEYNSPRLEEEPEGTRVTANHPKPSRQHAGFSLFFDYVQENQAGRAWQTRVYHEESGEEGLFSGTKTEPWLTWILERARLPGSVPEFRRGPEVSGLPIPERAPGIAPLERVDPGTARLEIASLDLDRAQPWPRAPEDKLHARVRFHVTGSGGSELVERRFRYRLEIHTVDLEQDTSALVATHERRLEPGLFNYERDVTFKMPEPGHYQVYCMILLPPPGASMDFCPGPVFRVVP